LCEDDAHFCADFHFASSQSIFLSGLGFLTKNKNKTGGRGQGERAGEGTRLRQQGKKRNIGEIGKRGNRRERKKKYRR
jgi:hypothetical protein